MDLIEFGNGDNERDRLLHFADQLETFLKALLSESRDRRYFIDGFQESYFAAWEELPIHFEFLREAIRFAEPVDFLLHGLSGNQLNFKFKVINHFSTSFANASNNNNYSNTFTNSILFKFMGSLDKLLASIMDAVGAGGAVGEFKDFMESLVDDGGNEQYA